MKRALIVYGPTASGKSAYAVAWAQKHGGEVINCDARQVYKGMAVGTGAISLEEQGGVPHHLLLFRDPAISYNVGDFLRDARLAEADVRSRGHVPVFVGGTGLYVQALVEGLSEGIAVDPALRAALEERDLADLVEELHRVDPDSTVDPHNKRYVVRALEIYRTTGKPKSALVLPKPSQDYSIVALTWPQHLLYERINRRHAAMFHDGLLEETAQLMQQPVAEEVWKTIGYAEARSYLAGHFSLEEAVVHAQTAARHYAKRQMTWLRRMAQRLDIRQLVCPENAEE